MGAAQAWDSVRGDGIVVAVTDTGLDFAHPDIDANVWTNPGEIANNGIDDDGNGLIDDFRGWDFVGPSWTSPAPDNDPTDVHGHGTHVAGTIAAEGNNATGVVGVAFRARIMALRGLDDAGSGGDAQLANAIVYAADEGADVINASWGGAGTSQTDQGRDRVCPFAGRAVRRGGRQRQRGRGRLQSGQRQQGAEGRRGRPVRRQGVVLQLRQRDRRVGARRRHPVAGAGDGRIRAAERHQHGGAARLRAGRAGDPGAAHVHARADPPGAAHVGRRHRRGGAGPGARLRARQRVGGGARSRRRWRRSSSRPSTASRSTPRSTLVGTARGPGFVRYIVERGAGTAPTTWTSLVNTTTQTPAAGGTLTTFNPSALADGIYTVRLRAIDSGNRTFSDQIQIRVRYLQLTNPAETSTPALYAELKSGNAVTVTGSATGPSFQSFRLEWAPGANATSGFATTGITLAGGGTSPVTSGTLGTWTPPATGLGEHRCA